MSKPRKPNPWVMDIIYEPVAVPVLNPKGDKVIFYDVKMLPARTRKEPTDD